MAAGGCAGANPPGDERAADGPRRAQPAAGELHRLARRLPRPGAGAGHPARRSSTPPSAASASTPTWSGSTAGRPSSPSRSGNISTAPPRRPGSRPAARSARSSTPTLAGDRGPLRRRRQVVLAIWGMESNYGGNRGSIPVIESLATLAYEGRRRSFAEEQLIAALRILQSGDVDAGGDARLLGRGDGAHPVHPDELSLDSPSTSPATAAATSGRTIRPTRWPRPRTTSRKAGWQRGRPWGVEVRLPQGFNYGSADQSNRRPVADWRARGVTLHRRRAAARPRLGGDHRPGRRARAGLRRLPELLRHQDATTTPPPTRWASAISATGSCRRRRRSSAGWPRGERELSRTEKIELQERLIARGHDTGATDGVIGPNTVAAIRAFQSQQGMTPDGFATAALLAASCADGRAPAASSRC